LTAIQHKYLLSHTALQQLRANCAKLARCCSHRSRPVNTDQFHQFLLNLFYCNTEGQIQCTNHIVRQKLPILNPFDTSTVLHIDLYREQTDIHKHVLCTV